MTRFCYASERASERASRRANAASENSLYARLHYHFCLPPLRSRGLARPLSYLTTLPLCLPRCSSVLARARSLVRILTFLSNERASSTWKIAGWITLGSRRRGTPRLRTFTTCRSNKIRYLCCAEERSSGIPWKPSQNRNLPFGVWIFQSRAWCDNRSYGLKELIPL